MAQTNIAAASSIYHHQVLEELDKIPGEHMPFLLRMIQAFRESVALPSAEESFLRGWSEAQAGETRPIEELWEGIDAE